MIEIENPKQPLVQDGVGVLLDPVAALVQHHVALGRDRFVRQHEIGHAVGLERHHLGEVLFRDALEEGRVVVRGEGVFVAADRRHTAAELVARMGRRALEHQVLEEVRNARLTRRLVGRPDLVPHHVRDNGCPVVRDHRDLHAV